MGGGVRERKRERAKERQKEKDSRNSRINGEPLFVGKGTRSVLDG